MSKQIIQLDIYDNFFRAVKVSSRLWLAIVFYFLVIRLFGFL